MITLETTPDKLGDLNKLYWFIGGKPANEPGCNRDETTILYNKRKWSPVDMNITDTSSIQKQNHAAYTCLQGNFTDKTRLDRIVLGHIFRNTHLKHILVLILVILLIKKII